MNEFSFHNEGNHVMLELNLLVKTYWFYYKILTISLAH